MVAQICLPVSIHHYTGFLWAIYTVGRLLSDSSERGAQRGIVFISLFGVIPVYRWETNI
jgi:hypothetical protein